MLKGIRIILPIPRGKAAKIFLHSHPQARARLEINAFCGSVCPLPHGRRTDHHIDATGIMGGVVRFPGANPVHQDRTRTTTEHDRLLHQSDLCQTTHLVPGQPKPEGIAAEAKFHGTVPILEFGFGG